MDARARPQRSGGVPPWMGEVGGGSLTPRDIHRKPRSLPAKLICRTSGATTGLGGCKIRVKNGANSAHMPCKFRATASADSAWITQEHHRLVHKAGHSGFSINKGCRFRARRYGLPSRAGKCASGGTEVQIPRSARLDVWGAHSARIVGGCKFRAA